MTGKPIIALETPWFRVERATERGEPYYLFHGSDAVIIFAITVDQRVILVRQYRPARGHVTLELPAGGIEKGEAPEAAAIRELREETGYLPGEVFALGRGGLGLDRDTAIMHGFVVFDARPDPALNPEPGIELELMPMAGFSALIRSGRFEQLGAGGVAFNALLCFKDRLAGLLAG
jgi:ADP-ribose pyrophosphatase